MFCPDFCALRADGQAGRNETPTKKSTQCPKAAHRIWWPDAIFLLATELEMCYNIPAKTSTATATPEKPGSTTSRADIMTPASVVSSMQMPLLTLVQALLFRATTCLPTA